MNDAVARADRRGDSNGQAEDRSEFGGMRFYPGGESVDRPQPDPLSALLAKFIGYIPKCQNCVWQVEPSFYSHYPFRSLDRNSMALWSPTRALLRLVARLPGGFTVNFWH